MSPAVAVQPAHASPIESVTLNRHSLAKYLGRSVQAIDRDIALRRLPAGFRIGRSRYWTRAEIDEWVKAGAPPQAEWEVRKAAQMC